MLENKGNIAPNLNEQEKGFIRELIRIAFTFGHDKDLFHKKVFEAFNVDTMRERNVVRIEEGVLSEELRAALNEEKLSEKEFVLCCLLAQGFSPEEITVMMGLKNSRTVSVKKSRINRKLQGSIIMEALFFALLWMILIYCLFSLFNVPSFGF